MAKVEKEAPPTELRISLHDRGMTPVLRAGLGGLAAALNAVPKDTLAKHGEWKVEPRSVTLRWHKPGQASNFFKALFAECFRIDKVGLIDLPATYTGTQDIAVRACLQDALRQTFLQHGQSTEKGGKPRPLTLEIDGVNRAVGIQPYKWFAHQDAYAKIAKELDRPAGEQSTLKFASWANPGAVERHVGLGVTNIEYTAAEALCAVFSLIGTISLRIPHGGALLICEPSDLLRFARARPRLSPKSLSSCYVAGGGDALLSVEVALRAATVRDDSAAVSAVTAWILRSTAWASQQKSRVQVLPPARHSEATLSAFQDLASTLPARIVPVAAKKKGELDGFFGSPSVLRGFTTENLAQGRPWHHGFATAKTPEDRPHFIHYFRAREGLGALRFPDDKKGLQVMTEHLDESESTLVRSVHTALRQRFGAIWDETRTNPAAFGKRCQGEREKWRLAFAGAKTRDQVRFALADLWSRAGTVKELQSGWQAVVLLLQDDKWQAARDLALVALASYEGRGTVKDEAAPESAADDS
jgi:CRISPR-associated protein Cas8a1/Csx13